MSITATLETKNTAITASLESKETETIWADMGDETYDMVDGPTIAVPGRGMTLETKNVISGSLENKN